MEVGRRAKHVLWQQFRVVTGIEPDDKGYVRCPRMNLLQTISSEVADQIEKDYREGSGEEWREKFRAVHSSAALAANTFGQWRGDPASLEVLGITGFKQLRFEGKCPTGLRGTPPNLDVLLEGDDDVLGIESKLLELLTPKKPEFSSSYCLEKLPQCEPQWWNLLQKAKCWPPRHFDVAQIIKHYLGLRKQYQDGRAIHLLYFFWEPEYAMAFAEYRDHREEIAEVSRLVVGSEVNFVAMSYPELWDLWEKTPGLKEHAWELERRYCVAI